MTSLVLAEHDNAALKSATLTAVTAAQKIGGEIHILVAGKGCGKVAEAAAKIAGVAKVRVADADQYATMLAEPLATLIIGMAGDYSHLIAPATTTGKNVMPRVAALLDVAQISDISAVVSADTFVRPIYAGNALATVQSKDAKKVITVRGSTFDKAKPEGGSAAVENVPAAANPALSSFVSQELSKSERPELTSA
ncbi:MAG: electron transfer flavoprotein subunit alpha/FixB family protein, partial [Micropepsaceae bacterium]